MSMMTSAPLDKTDRAAASQAPPGAVRVRRAVLSAYDKTGLVEFARVLHALKIELISTGGTLRVLREAGIEARAVEDLTGFGAMLGGRVKTLHPKLLGGILARPNRAEDVRDLKEAGIAPCELVVVNLYPFDQAASDPKASKADALELIDVGGPTMIRAAAKNHESVAVVCNSSDYEALAAELQDSGGHTSAPTRARLAAQAFATTAAYDARIAEYLGRQSDEKEATDFPPVFGDYVLVSSLRYGENPHQRAAIYAVRDPQAPSLARAKILSGKELSYNNYGDLDAAWRMAADFTEPFAAVFKHATPCGAATGETIREAYIAAHATDPMSAYGSIVALNRRVDPACAEALHETTFIECVLAPGFDEDALALLTKKKARRFLEVPTMDLGPGGAFRFREIVGGILMQDDDAADVRPDDLKIVTRVKPTDEQITSLLLARKIVKHAKSNAIALVRGNAAVGIGAGQTSRVDAVHQAVAKAGDRCRGAVLGSDAFFPMADGVEAATAAGVAAIIQPGGSKRDAEVIAACDQAGVAMVLTGVRSFRH